MVRLEVRDAAHHLHPLVEGPQQGSPPSRGCGSSRSAGKATSCRSIQGRISSLHLLQGLDRHQAGIADVNVTADGQGALGDRPAAELRGLVSSRPRPSARGLQVGPELAMPSSRVPLSFMRGQPEAQGRVQMEVTVDEGRRHQLAGGGNLLVCCRPRGRGPVRTIFPSLMAMSWSRRPSGKVALRMILTSI